MYRASVRLSAALLCLMAIPAMAGEGRIPIFAPVVLDAVAGKIDGRYVVTRNVTAVAGAPVITIIGTGFEEVDIDLNGFTLFGDPAGGVDIISATGLMSLVVRDGSLRALGPPPGDSLHVEESQKVIAEDLRISDGGMGILLVHVSNFQIRRNVIVGADPGGIMAIGDIIAGHPPVTGTIADNVIRDSASHGIAVIDGHDSVAILNNRVKVTLITSGLSLSSGIRIESGGQCLIAENTVEEAAEEGIFIESTHGCKVKNNVVGSNGANGILALGVSDTLFLDNVAVGNAYSGILNGGFQNHYDRNVLNTNGCYGLWLTGPDSTYGRNTARGNFGGPVAGGCSGAGLDCAVPPVEVCPPPLGGGSAAPDLCFAGFGNTSFCDNLMPGPPPS